MPPLCSEGIIGGLGGGGGGFANVDQDLEVEMEGWEDLMKVVQEIIEIRSMEGKKQTLLEMLKLDLKPYFMDKETYSKVIHPPVSSIIFVLSNYDVLRKKTVMFAARKIFASTPEMFLCEANSPSITIHGGGGKGIPYRDIDGTATLLYYPPDDRQLAQGMVKILSLDI
ncbi:hypothetical protein Aduo_018230 [Ancylostoma duodenale]